MLLTSIEVLKNQGRNTVYMFKILDAEDRETIDLLTPMNVERISGSGSAVVIFFKNRRLKLQVNPTDKVLRMLGGFADLALGYGSGLKLMEYYGNMNTNNKSKKTGIK